MKVLITGGSSGIGFLTGCVLASRGHDVIFTVKTNNEVSNLKEKISFLDLSISVLKLDITNREDIDNIQKDLLDFDVLFLHAGIGNIGLLSNIDIQLVKETFNVNVFSNLELIQKFLVGDNKRVIMMSSLLANKSLPFFSSYSMSKSCIDIMVKTLRKENIFNNNEFILIKPGAYHTGFNQYMILSGQKSNLEDSTIDILNKLFLIIEEYNLNSIVTEIVMAIERGNKKCYYAPFWQKVLMNFIN